MSIPKKANNIKFKTTNVHEKGILFKQYVIRWFYVLYMYMATSTDKRG